MLREKVWRIGRRGYCVSTSQRPASERENVGVVVFLGKEGGREEEGRGGHVKCTTE